ncbi:hypothetical protein BDR22DRAFT_923125 [Usnea florida]
MNIEDENMRQQWNIARRKVSKSNTLIASGDNEVRKRAAKAFNRLEPPLKTTRTAQRCRRPRKRDHPRPVQARASAYLLHRAQRLSRRQHHRRGRTHHPLHLHHLPALRPDIPRLRPLPLPNLPFRIPSALICNAGAMAIPPSTTQDGYENPFGINQFAHALLMKNLLPTLQRTTASHGDAHIIFVASEGFRMPPFGGIVFPQLRSPQNITILGRWLRYGQSKLANVVYASELAKRSRTPRPSIFIPVLSGRIW